jgi:hypothetical protein
MILPEQYQTYYEGSTSATTISTSTGTYNRRVIAISTSEVLSAVTRPGASGSPATLVLFILDGSNAGTAIPITQTLLSPASGTTDFVLSSPLPQGTFNFAINPAYNIFTVSGNTIDTSGTISTALAPTSDMANVNVTGNTFKGDDGQDINNWFSQAIRVSDYGAQAGGSTLGTYNVNTGNFTYSVSIVTMSGVVISGNTIDDPVGGIHIWVATR